MLVEKHISGEASITDKMTHKMHKNCDQHYGCFSYALLFFYLTYYCLLPITATLSPNAVNVITNLCSVSFACLKNTPSYLTSSMVIDI